MFYFITIFYTLEPKTLHLRIKYFNVSKNNHSFGTLDFGFTFLRLFASMPVRVCRADKGEFSLLSRGNERHEHVLLQSAINVPADSRYRTVVTRPGGPILIDKRAVLTAVSNSV